MPAVAAAQPQEAVGQDAAFEEGIKLVFDEHFIDAAIRLAKLSRMAASVIRS